MDKEDLLALVVLFNPSDFELENVINHHKIFNQLLVIDNSEITHIHKFAAFKTIKYLHYSENIGLSKAYNLGIEYCLNNSFIFMLIMDQDSEFPNQNPSFDGTLFTEIKRIITQNSLNLSQYAVLAFTPHSNPHQAVKLTPELSFNQIAISSGSIINVNICAKLGKFDERLFIDTIDLEYCFRALENNYKIVQFSNLNFKHQVGYPRTFIHLGEKISSSNHQPLRYYYLIRNNLLLEQLYKKSNYDYISHFAQIACADTLKKLVLVRYENERFLKYYYALLGMYHFYINQFGKIPEEKIVYSELEIINILSQDHGLREYFLLQLIKLEILVNENFLIYNNTISGFKNNSWNRISYPVRIIKRWLYLGGKKYKNLLGRLK